MRVRSIAAVTLLAGGVVLLGSSAFSARDAQGSPAVVKGDPSKVGSSLPRPPAP